MIMEHDYGTSFLHITINDKLKYTEDFDKCLKPANITFFDNYYPLE